MSAMIRFACGACEHVLEVSAALAGKRGRCTSCKSIVRVPGATKAKKVVPAKLQSAADPEAVSPLSSLITGAVFGGAGLLMASRLLSGEAEFVRGPRTSHWLVTVLGEHTFMVVAMLACLLIGFAAVAVGVSALRGKLAPAAA
jgi:hypothetical protein